MEQEILRNEYKRLIYPEDLATALESYKLITDAGFEIMKTQKEKTQNIENTDAIGLYEMTILKNLSIFKLAESLNYNSNIGDFIISNRFDPFALSSIIRTQYEAFCTFNNIFRLSKTAEERKFKYNLWVLSGLKYRQNFPTKLEENIKKKQDEKLEIIDLLNKIRGSEVYQHLNTESKDRIENAIKRKNWQVATSGDEANIIPWHEMFNNAGVNAILEGQYSSLSLNAHPSNVSVFQFADMFLRGNDLPNSIFTIKISKWLISLLIADYCYYFKDAKERFDGLPIMTQILVNSYNLMCRNESFKINDASKILN